MFFFWGLFSSVSIWLRIHNFKPIEGTALKISGILEQSVIKMHAKYHLICDSIKEVIKVLLKSDLRVENFE